jgi:EAL domain-containing protein (putative c-di-GMP-specific phosphodiesterase class I)
VELYRPDSEEVQRRRGDLGWVERINAALANEGFVLVGQPIVAANAGHAQERHLEVLSRMIDVTGEQIPPGKFIPTAERYNLMPQIDRWVVAHALATLRDQRAWENGLTTAWVNLSAATVGDPGFAQFVREQLQRYQVPARGLCFEITETAAIANVARAAQFISELSQHGVRFALDDFGAGLSSFGYLKHLAIDFLKIDGGFVGNILRNPVDHAIVRAINEIGHVMQICTVAEWVETPEVLDELRRLGVDFVQGFGIARPMPLASFQPAQQHLLPA